MAILFSLSSSWKYKTGWIHLLIAGFLTLGLFLAFTETAKALVITWDGEGSTVNWSDCDNWTSNTCPGTGDIATFDATSTKNATINPIFGGSVAGIDINSGYTGTITQARALTVGTSNYDQADGTFTGGSQAMDFNGSFVLSGGTFTSTSGTMNAAGAWTHTAAGTFNHNNGTVIFDGGNKTWDFNSSLTGSGSFYNFTDNNTTANPLTLGLSDTLVVTNTLTLTDGAINTGTIDIRGDVVVGSAFNGGTTVLTFTGSANQNFDLTGGEAKFDANITINKTAGTVTMLSDITMDSTDTLSVTAGTLDINGKAFSQTNGTFTVDGGSFLGSTGSLNLDGAITLSAGTLRLSSGSTTIAGAFTHTAGGTFEHNNGSATYDGNNKTWDFNSSLTGSGIFYNFTDNNTSANPLTLGASDTLIVTNTLTLTDGAINTGTMDARGNVVVGAAFNGGTTALTFTGSANQNFDLTGGEATFDANITINKTAGTVTMLSDITMDSTDTLSVTAGTLDINGKAFSQTNGTFTVDGGSFLGSTGSLNLDGAITLSAGTLRLSSGTTTIAGAFTHTAGGTFEHNSGSVTFDGGNKTWDFNSSLTGSGTFYNFTVNNATANPNALAVGDALVVVNTLTLTDGTFNTGTFDARGNVVIGAAFNGGSTLLRLTGLATQTFDLTAATDTFNADITINKTGGAVNLASALVMDAANQDLIVREGTFDLSSYNLTVNGTSGTLVVEDGGNLQLQGDEVITANSGYPQLDAGCTVTYDATSGSRSIKDYTYKHLTINGAGGTFTMGAGETLGGNLTVTNGTLDVNDQTLSINGNTTINGGTLKTGIGVNTFGDAAGDTVTISSGTLEIESDNTTNDIVKTAGTWTNSGGTIVYNAGSSISTNLLSSLSPYNHLTINSSGTTYTLDGTLDINGTLTITAGTLDVSASNSYGITVGGNWSNTGTFTQRSGTVTFDSSGTSTLSGSTTFNHFTSTTAGKTLTFTAGTTQTIAGTFTITGASGNLVVLQSSAAGSAWNLTINGSSSVSYANVSDSNASGGNAIVPENSTNSGGNTNWSFNQAPTVSGITATVATNGTGNVTVSFVADDPDDNNTLEALIEYNIGSGWQKATISEVASDLTATYGTPDVENDNTRQVGNAIGYITTSSGANTVTVVWNSKTDAPNADLTTAQVRVTPHDGTDAGTAQAYSNFTLDNVAPSGLANFISTSTTSSSITWTWTAASDTRFDHYEVWYGTTQADVNNRGGTASEWDNDPNDTNLSTASTATTTITGLSENTTYYAKIWAIDTYGNESTLSAATANNNGRPTLSNLTASQSSRGDGGVTIAITVDDADDDNTLQLLVEYNVGSGWQKATISEVASDLTATYGTPDVENDNNRQVGNVTGYIPTSSGANTITFVWHSRTDVATAALNTAQIRITPYDGIETGAALTKTDVKVDNVAPAGLAGLAKSSATSTSMTLSWTAVTNESFFNHYEIWYGISETDVNNRGGTATEWDNDNHAGLASVSTVTTTITNLSEGTTYFFKIFAVDDGGNEQTLNAFSARTNTRSIVTSVSPTVATNGTGYVTISLVVDDGDDEGVELLVEYNVGNGWQKATLSEVASDITVSLGTAPTIENDNARQVGQTGSRLTTAGGTNTVTVVWLAKTDAPTANLSNAQLRVAAYDGNETGLTNSSTSFALDMVAPAGLANLGLLTNGNILSASWTPVSSESNFHHYELWYGTSMTDVLNRNASRATEYDHSHNAALATMTTSSITIASLSLKTGVYSVALWAIDLYGNETGPLSQSISIRAGSGNASGISSGTDTVSGIAGGGGGGGGDESESSEVSTVSEDETQSEITDEESISEESSEVPEPEATTSESDDAVQETETTADSEIADAISEAAEVSSETATTAEITTTDELPSLQEVVAEVENFIPEDLSWSATSLKDFGSLDIVQTIENTFDQLNVTIFNFFFQPSGFLSRLEVLQLSMHVFVGDLFEQDYSLEELLFTDILKDSDEAFYLAEGQFRGIVEGYGDGTFQPGRTATRAEALKILLTSAKIHIVLDRGQGLLAQFGFTENPFKDLDLKDWSAPYVLYAYQKGWVQGFPDETFRGNQAINRAEFSSMLTTLYNEWQAN